ncbi:histone deacetylase 8-like [Musca vetustissima]|uniref:histone deacetylase 8-like n=1 Tax=Musca vetustissima TaxID=27455 RepID=UPI002AB5E522|nr:histone deacetylase 8-like [Musca vetustissima]
MSRKIKYVYSDYLISQADKNPAVKGRASLTHNLIKSYGLLSHMERIRPVVANSSDLKGYHNADYVKQLNQYEDLSKIDKENVNDSFKYDPDDNEEDVLDDCLLSDSHGLCYDCPPWPGVKNYVYAIAGATMTACQELCKSSGSNKDIILNWCGGWHHAQKGKAAGFCYVNDIVLGILVLTTKFRRILYVDLDNHHGDGVEEAFATTRRVFCLSFHQMECGYYPGTGSLNDMGRENCLGYTANFPYKRGITGDKYRKYFKRIFSAVCQAFKPSVCVIQCGADVIVGDPLGGSNLIPEDLIECIRAILNYPVPCVFLGGGGYNMANSSRYWCQLTAAICQETLEDDIPADNENFLKYGPDYCLNIKRMPTLRDENKDEDLEEQAEWIEGNLKLYKVYPV